MADAGRDDGTAPQQLLVWALSTFHAALLVAVAVGLLYAAGVLGDQLAALDTVVGVFAYFYLWGVTWWTNRRMLASVDHGILSGSLEVTAVLAGAMQWGAVAGLLVFLPAFVVIGGFVAAAGGVEAVPFLLLAGAIGALLAAGVGVVAGALLAVLDLLLLRAARAWMPVQGTGSGSVD